MPTFRKQVLTKGVYNVKTPTGRKMTPITEEYIQKTCDTANKMIEAGIRIPAPFAHKDDDGVYPSPLLADDIDAKTAKKKRWSSDINGGFWNKFETNEDGELIGEVEVDESVAEKVGNTIKETSVFVLPEWTDGEGREWENALYHVAMVTNPVESGQDNFEELKETPELAVAMSFAMSDEINSSLEDTNTNKITELIGLLSERLNIALPGDTSPDNFFDRLVTVLLNINQEEVEDITTPQKGSSPESSPVIMSQDNKDNLVELQTQAGSLLGQLVESLKTNLKQRVQGMVEKGKIGKAYAETTISPQIEALAMSLEDLTEEGALPKSPLEMSLDVLDANESLTDATPATDTPKKDVPDETSEMTEDEELSTEDLEDCYAKFM